LSIEEEGRLSGRTGGKLLKIGLVYYYCYRAIADWVLGQCDVRLRVVEFRKRSTGQETNTIIAPSEGNAMRNS